MAVGVTEAVANSVITLVFGGVTYYIQLHSGDPGAAGTANVASFVSGRGAVTFGTAAGGKAVLTGTKPSWTSTGAGSVTHGSVWTASTGGTFRGSGAFSTPVVVTAAGQPINLEDVLAKLQPLAA